MSIFHGEIGLPYSVPNSAPRKEMVKLVIASLARNEGRSNLNVQESTSVVVKHNAEDDRRYKLYVSLSVERPGKNLGELNRVQPL